MAYPWVIQKVRDLISGLSATNQTIDTLTPTPPPIGGIIDYYGALDTSGKYPITSDGHINYNWHVCDGTDGTPNLVGKTIIGASKATYGDEGGSDTVTPSVTVNSATQSVSVNGHTLTTAEMPSHNHESNDGGRFFALYTNNGIEAQGLSLDGGYWYEGKKNNVGITYTGSNHAHSHGVTTSAHTHELNISSFDNRSSYKALYKIMRLA